MNKDTQRPLAAVVDEVVEFAVSESKRCARCKSLAPRHAFYKDRRAADGLRSDCKNCSLLTTKAWRAANPARHKELQAETAKRRVATTESSEENLGRKWSGADDEILLREDISIAEMSRMLGRTYGATAVARHKAKERAKNVLPRPN